MDSHFPSAAADPRRRLALVAAVYLGSFIAKPRAAALAAATRA